MRMTQQEKGRTRKSAIVNTVNKTTMDGIAWQNERISSRADRGRIHSYQNSNFSIISSLSSTVHFDNSECSAIAKPSPVALSVDGMMPVFQANPLPGGRPMQALAHLGFGLEDWLLSDLELMLDSSADKTGMSLEMTRNSTLDNLNPLYDTDALNKASDAIEATNVHFNQSPCFESDCDSSVPPDYCNQMAFSPYGELDNMNNVTLLSPDQLVNARNDEDGLLNAPVYLGYVPEPSAMLRQSSLDMVLDVLGEGDCENEKLSPAAQSSDATASAPAFIPAPEQSRLCDVNWAQQRNRVVSWDGAIKSNATDVSYRARSASDEVSFRDGGFNVDAFINKTLAVQGSRATADLAPPEANNTLIPVELTCDDCSIDSVGFSLASDSTSEQSPCYSDVNEMLNDLLKTAEEPQLTNAVEVSTNSASEVVIEDHDYACRIVSQSTSLAEETGPSKENTVMDLTVPAPATPTVLDGSTRRRGKPVLNRSDSYTIRRSRNNEACRESRKRKRLEQENAEQRVHSLTEENKSLREKIRVLEVEVQETRSLLISRFKFRPAA